MAIFGIFAYDTQSLMYNMAILKCSNCLGIFCRYRGQALDCCSCLVSNMLFIVTECHQRKLRIFDFFKHFFKFRPLFGNLNVLQMPRNFVWINVSLDTMYYKNFMVLLKETGCLGSPISCYLQIFCCFLSFLGTQEFPDLHDFLFTY